ncbi:tyrosine-type recombinase/integrase [Candidatus Falkowbacteria bacterium]|nr:tyrosine-type recombinase/integrase [Candidatus Falkowbacteria bacterium]
MSKSQKPIIDYLYDFLDYLEIEKGLASESQKNYSRFLKKFFDWLEDTDLAELKPGQLTADHVWKYRLYLSRHQSERSRANLKKSTQNYYLIALRNLLAYFVEKDITSLPPDKIKLAKEKSDKQVTFLKIDQIEKLLLAPDTTSVSGLRDRAILETLFSTGLRVAELTRLDRDQLKIKPGSNTFLEISITGKGSKVRTVYFSERTVQWLAKYLAKRSDIDPALFINFTTAQQKSESRRLTVRSIENIVKKYIKISGLPIMSSPHTLRHSYATDLLSQGVDLRLVQEFLGHANIATTQIYTHVTNKQLRDVHQKFHSGKNLKN